MNEINIPKTQRVGHQWQCLECGSVVDGDRLAFHECLTTPPPDSPQVQQQSKCLHGDHVPEFGAASVWIPGIFISVCIHCKCLFHRAYKI